MTERESGPPLKRWEAQLMGNKKGRIRGLFQFSGVLSSDQRVAQFLDGIVLKLANPLG